VRSRNALAITDGAGRSARRHEVGLAGGESNQQIGRGERSAGMPAPARWIAFTKSLRTPMLMRRRSSRQDRVLGADRDRSLDYGSAVTIAPSTCALSPETYDAAGERRKAAKRPSSIGSP
jgi:hypothetical protein